MGDWKKFNETSLPGKKELYSNLNLKDVTYSEYSHIKRICKDFEVKYLDVCHDLYLKSNTLLLDDIFKNFLKICLQIYELDPAKFLSAPGLGW